MRVAWVFLAVHRRISWAGLPALFFGVLFTTCRYSLKDWPFVSLLPVPVLLPEQLIPAGISQRNYPCTATWRRPWQSFRAFCVLLREKDKIRQTFDRRNGVWNELSGAALWRALGRIHPNGASFWSLGYSSDFSGGLLFGFMAGFRKRGTKPMAGLEVVEREEIRSVRHSATALYFAVLQFAGYGWELKMARHGWTIRLAADDQMVLLTSSCLYIICTGTLIGAPG